MKKYLFGLILAVMFCLVIDVGNLIGGGKIPQWVFPIFAFCIFAGWCGFGWFLRRGRDAAAWRFFGGSMFLVLVIEEVLFYAY